MSATECPHGKKERFQELLAIVNQQFPLDSPRTQTEQGVNIMPDFFGPKQGELKYALECLADDNETDYPYILIHTSMAIIPGTEKQQVKYNTIKYTGNDNLIFSINKVISH